MDKPLFSAETFRRRRQHILKTIPEDSVAFVVSADELPRNGDQAFPYRQSSDLFYLTGISQEQTILALCPAHPKDKFTEVLFLRRSSKDLEKWEGHKLTKEEAARISGIEVKNIYWFDEFENYLPELMYYANNVYIATNGNMKYLRFYNDADYRFIERLHFLYPLHNYRRLSPILVDMRLRKDSEELLMIKYAIELTAKAFDRVLKFVRPGVYEYEVEAEIMHEFIRHGVRTVAYESIIASGANACVLHYINNNGVCKDGDLLLMDFGAEYNNYAADLTRTIPVNGKFSQRQLDVYQAVLDVQRQMISEYIKPGVTINELNDKSRELIAEKLVDLDLIKPEEKQDESKVKEYYPHGLSHFMGLDVHDVGTKDTELEPGMVITVEPGIYIDQEGLGIRLENDVLITAEGCEDLMKDIPLDPRDIEGRIGK